MVGRQLVEWSCYKNILKEPGNHVCVLEVIKGQIKELVELMNHISS